MVKIMAGLFLIDFLKLGSNMGFMVGFENSQAYYGLQGPYADPSSSAGPAHNLGCDKVGIRAQAPDSWEIHV